jgi:hypothetical protein
MYPYTPAAGPPVDVGVDKGVILEVVASGAEARRLKQPPMAIMPITAIRTARRRRGLQHRMLATNDLTAFGRPLAADGSRGRLKLGEALERERSTGERLDGQAQQQ